MIDNVALLDLRAGTRPAALAGIERWLRASGRGTLYACWQSTLGPIHRVLLWRGFETEQALHDDAMALALSRDPFGAGEHLAKLQSNSFRRFPFLAPLSMDAGGPLFEVRDYLMRQDGLTAIMESWEPLLPARLKLSPMLTAMYALTGAVPRILHIYPWKSLEHRAEVRGSAQKVGWPPKQAPQQVLRQDSTIYTAAACSPIQ